MSSTGAKVMHSIDSLGRAMVATLLAYIVSIAAAD
jgi:hypothetical protein